MHPNTALLERFYAAFAAGDHATMAGCYADDASFSDPVFPQLNADEVRAMWRMFCTSGNDIDVRLRTADADDAKGSASWGADYAFPTTGRQVRNAILASFTFRDGLIVEHRDDFNLWRWSRMALGPVGAVLGWTPMVQRQIRRQAAAQLHRFAAAEAADHQ
jgi:ketosteroid isomerase-like protein